MNKLATLGPKGTYSESAALKYIQSTNSQYEIEYFGSIKKVLNSVGVSSDIAVLPIENFSEGYVSLVLDHLIDSDLSIVSELLLPIQFSFVSDTADLTAIDRLFVQFVAKGQCSEYIDGLDNTQIITTQSNIESLNRVLQEAGNCAAIVPSGSFDPTTFKHVVENVNDYKNNQTRFLALSKYRSQVDDVQANTHWKTSLVVFDDHDRPGLLAEVLTSFASRQVNLTSIISRPTKIEFGQYNFLIDVQGHYREQAVAEAIDEINKIAKVKNMGSYPAAKVHVTIAS
ncbi:prephenate dehydratase domain-containing protein [Paraglaciecola aquimarina]|uniref:prephenate dehydratase n=1 Tax=Paraglaciecola aquimarina TaxID=1235557 RepID=A0ABU3T2C9_9ALTE|nr:prephenate dehydratase domain-containing protein [Paraglaciecola aquimarina]MDU0356424.1 prephenate dehydratase domain-containing protein [Paraglaciecola aquimarina]